MQTSRRTVTLGPLACAAALLLAACAGDVDGPEWLRARARPVALQTELDRDRAASRVVTAAGGTLSATGSDGTRYRLRIPQGALLADERITLTPLRSVRGLPLRGGSVAAVHVEPSGLQLMKPAVLTIRPTRPVPVAEQVAFGYYGNGRDAHAYPLTGDPARVEMQLVHFSGYGFGRAAPDDPGRAALQRASAHEARLQARVAEILGRERARQQRGEEPSDTGDPLKDAAIEYFDAVLRPLMRTAETDERMAGCCMQRYLGWERQIQLLGMDAAGPRPGASDRELERRRMEGEASAARILANAYEKGVERAVRQCRQEHDLTAVSTLLGLERQRQLLGGDTTGPEIAAFRRAWEAMERCFRFEVEFSSSFDVRSAADGARMHNQVKARIPVDVGSTERRVPGSGPLQYVSHVTDVDGSKMVLTDALGLIRSRAAGTRPGLFAVEKLDWSRNPRVEPGTGCDGRDEEPGAARTDTVTLTFRIGAPTNVIHSTFRDRPADVRDAHDWSEAWAAAHQDEQAGTAAPSAGADFPDMLFKMVLVGREPGLWRVDFRRAAPGATAGVSSSEDGYLIVRHTPR